jgi:hypothetical protein
MNPIMSVSAVLSLVGIVVAGFQVTEFHSEVRQTLSLFSTPAGIQLQAA